MDELNTNIEDLETLLTPETIALNDLITITSGLTVSASSIKKWGNIIQGNITFSGTATTLGSGHIFIGTFKDAYAPIINFGTGCLYNSSKSSTIQIYSPGVLFTMERTKLYLATGSGNTTYGGSTYGFATSSGIRFTYLCAS